MTNVTFLGQGAMGSRMAHRAEAADFTVTRWNRSSATITPRQAVADADVVIAVVRDDEASQAVWTGTDGALAGIKQGALIIESSTLTCGWVRELAAQAVSTGAAFLDAPVLGSRPQAEAGQLIHLIGGEEADVVRATRVLVSMGAKQIHAGPVGSGAALKLIANTLFGIQVTAMAELIGAMTRLGLDPAATVANLAQTPLLSPAAQGAAGLMLADKRDPMFPIDLVAKDFGYAIDEAADMPMASAALGVFKAAMALGLGDRNLTAVCALYR